MGTNVSAMSYSPKKCIEIALFSDEEIKRLREIENQNVKLVSLIDP